MENKTWNDMTDNEKAVAVTEMANSLRGFVTDTIAELKIWDDILVEAESADDVMERIFAAFMEMKDMY